MRFRFNRGVAFIALATASSLTFAANPGFYLGAGAGFGQLDTPNNYFQSDLAPEVDQSKSIGGLSGRVFAGYNLNQYLGIEGGFTKYANSSYNSSATDGFDTISGSLTYKMHTFDLVGKVYLPLGAAHLFSVYALGGVAYTNSNINEDITDTVFGLNGATNETTTAFLPKFGLGAQYTFASQPHLSMGVELTHVKGKGNVKAGDPSAIPNANMATVNLIYTV